jgi:RNA polymerase sigma-70 factor (ECF subfamily)
LNADEEQDFTELVQRQSRFVFRVAYTVLLNSYDAEDAVQETFLKLYRNGGWQHLHNERAFLARVAWRVAVDRLPRASAKASAASDANSDRTLDNGALSPAPGPEQILLHANQHAVIHSMIDTLPEELRVPLVLSAFEELHSREIGGILGVPEGTVRTRIQRARKLLRQKLDPSQETRYA